MYTIKIMKVGKENVNKGLFIRGKKCFWVLCVFKDKFQWIIEFIISQSTRRPLMILALTYWLSFFATYVSMMQSNILLLLCFMRRASCVVKSITRTADFCCCNVCCSESGCCCLPEILRLGLPYFKAVIRLWVEQLLIRCATGTVPKSQIAETPYRNQGIYIVV